MNKRYVFVVIGISISLSLIYVLYFYTILVERALYSCIAERQDELPKGSDEKIRKGFMIELERHFREGNR